MDILTPLQKRFILKFSQSPFQKSFFLTGGTALAGFYLFHRYSEDLDFFTEAPEEVRMLGPWLEETARDFGLQLEVRRQSHSFLGCFFEAQNGEILNVDFAQDAPFRLEKTRLLPDLQIYVDNLTDIACNKLSALYDRAEPKDFVDLYFLDREFFPFEKILELAKKKHVGLDDYWLAQSLERVRMIEKLPRMLKAVDIPTLQEFFTNWVKKLIK